MVKCFICCYENSDISKWPKINIPIYFVYKKISSTEFILNLPIHYLKVKEGFNAKKIRGHRTRLLNKLDLMKISGHF